MIRGRRQDDIRRRLALLGDGPAAFYVDACAILESNPRLGTAAHLLGHCLREIESALRRVLLPRDYKDPEPCAGCGSRPERHAAQVHAILKAYGFAAGDVVFDAWLRLSDRDDLSLHRFAHRDTLGRPREIDATVEELWDVMEGFLVALLDRFESRFADHLPFIDALLRKEQPGKRDVTELLTRIPQNEITAEYFFSRATGAWLDPLRKAGVFDDPPPGETDGIP